MATRKPVKKQAKKEGRPARVAARPAPLTVSKMRVISIKKPAVQSREDIELDAAMRGAASTMLPASTRTPRGDAGTRRDTPRGDAGTPRGDAGVTVSDLKGKRGRKIAATYDSAQTTDDNRRHWAAADSLSANAANSLPVRRTLRDRARYEVGSNSYAKGIILTLAHDMIGTGPRLQMMGDDQKLNQRVEKLWAAHARRIRLAAKLRTAVMAKTVDGESFAMPISNRKYGADRVQADLLLVECDQFTSLGQEFNTPNAIDGIVFDADGNPEIYHMLKTHPGDQHGAQWEVEPITAGKVFHWFRCDRPGQLRGVPEITPALPLFAQLRRYTLAVLNAAESAAEHSGLIHTDAPPNDETVDMAPLETLETEKGMLTFLPGGWKFTQLEAEQPTTNYGDFKSEIVGEIARCVNMPILLALLRAKDYNMASGRLDLQTYFKTLEVERDDLECAIIDPFWETWLAEASNVFKLGIGIDDEAAAHSWLWTTREHTDPADEAQAAKSRRSTWRSSLAEEYARTGDDWHPAVMQIIKEAEVIAARLKITVKEAFEMLGIAGGPVTSGRPPGVQNGDGEPKV